MRTRLCGRILRKCRPAARVLPVLAAALCCASCVREFPDAPAEASAGGSRGMLLALQVALADQAGFSDADEQGRALPDVEKMRDLRVVITTKDGVGKEYVEYNRYLDFGDATQKWRYKCGYMDDDRLMFKVAEGSDPKKHVYLFANCEPLLGEVGLPDPEHGVYGDVGANRDVVPEEATDALRKLRDLTYTNEQLQEWVKPAAGGSEPNGIPMCAEYDVTVTPGNTGLVNTHVLQAYILRAANKITFTYVNVRSQYPIFVQNWELRMVADKAYLLPHVDESAHNSALVKDFDGWIFWYANHSSTQSGVGVQHATAQELEFTVPQEAAYASYNGVAAGDTYADMSGETDKGTQDRKEEEVTGLKLEGFDYSEQDSFPVTDTRVYYFPETRFFPPEAAGNEQEYALWFRTIEHSSSGQAAGDGTTRFYTDTHNYQPSNNLPWVRTLFRNTHVKIYARFQEGSQVTLGVSVMGWEELPPYTGQLKPE